jgi:hypothetical protein
MFGFARLASFDYFGHVAQAIEARFRARGKAVQTRVCEVHPTSSIRRRASRLARMIDETAGPHDPIHVVGHSTGGLDARLVASPGANLGDEHGDRLGWIERLRSVTTINTPHYGTPLATFFATVNGQRLLYAISALTVAALKLGAPPLAATSALVAAFGRGASSRLLGLELDLVDRTADAIIKVLDEASSRELRAWLRLLRDDQGGIVQLTPEAMDLFQASVRDRPSVKYQCVATYVPEAGLFDRFSTVRSPWLALSATLFGVLHGITARHDDHYPCAPRERQIERLRALLGEVLPLTASDGIVPLASQLWGEIAWIGRADHLDVVGHFHGREDGHNDWLASGARFNRMRFDTMMDRVVTGMIAAEGS